MKESVINIKSYQFSIRIGKLYQFIQNEQKEYVLARQIHRVLDFIAERYQLYQ